MNFTHSEALQSAFKGLSGCFIISIVITNCVLIYVVAKAGRLFYTPRSLVVAAIACGDILLAAMAIMNAAMTFTSVPFSSKYCVTVSMVDMYIFYINNFAFGVGLITMAVELVVRYKREVVYKGTFKECLIALGLCLLPWILSMVFGFSLLFGSTDDTEYCTFISERSFRSDIVFVLFTAPLAMATSLSVMFIRLKSAQKTSYNIVYQGPTKIATLNRDTPASENQDGPAHNNACSDQGISRHVIVSPGEGGDSLANPQFLRQQNIPDADMIVTTPVTYIIQQPNRNSRILPEADKERRNLLIISVVYFLCVMPYPCFLLTITTGPDQHKLVTERDTIIEAFFYWLSISRSLLTPLIWIILFIYK